MLYESLLLLVNQLNAYFDTIRKTDSNFAENPAKLESIATLPEDDLKTKEGVFISLVNVSEEFTLKNTPAYRKEGALTVYKNPPVFLNLYVLFCVHMPGHYDKALMHLSHIVRFFQGKNVFTDKNSFSAKNAFGDLVQFKLILDLYSPTFEQANYLWSTLGGKQHPYLLYKLRLLEIERDSTTETRDVITSISATEKAAF